MDAKLSAGQVAPQAGMPATTPASLKGYAQAALVLTVTPEGEANHRVLPPVGGSSVGLAAAVGRFVGSTLAIEVEVVRQGTSTHQQFQYFWSDDYTGESRDWLLNGNVRWRPRRTRHLELVGGGGVAFSRFTERDIVETNPYPPATVSSLPDETFSDVQPTIGGGADLRISLSTRIDILPSFRVRWVARDPEGLAAFNGAGNYSYHIGAVLRFKL